MALNIDTHQQTSTILRIYCIVATLISGSIIFGPIVNFPPLYYAMLSLAIFCSLTNARLQNTRILIFLGACMLSVIVADPPSLFKPWLRLGLLGLVIFAVFPVYTNNRVASFRYQLLKYSVILCLIIGATGIICYLLGINYMIAWYKDTKITTTGAFGGLARHSMVLGLCAAIGLVTSLWGVLLNKHRIPKRNLFIICLICCFLSLLLSASRSATGGAIIGCLVLLYINYRQRISKLLGIGFAIVGLLVLAFPAYENYAHALIDKQESNLKKGSSISSREDKWNNRIAEFESSPIFGVGFASVNKEYREDYSAKTGVVEPGSSYLSLLSMVGIFGLTAFLCVVIPILKRLYRSCVNSPTKSENLLLISIIAVLLVSMIAEGYILAGGSYFCFFFWLTLGVADTNTSKLCLIQ